jgi:hypothetical protein
VGLALGSPPRYWRVPITSEGEARLSFRRGNRAVAPPSLIVSAYGVAAKQCVAPPANRAGSGLNYPINLDLRPAGLPCVQNLHALKSDDRRPKPSPDLPRPAGLKFRDQRVRLSPASGHASARLAGQLRANSGHRAGTQKTTSATRIAARRRCSVIPAGPRSEGLRSVSPRLLAARTERTREDRPGASWDRAAAADDRGGAPRRRCRRAHERWR